MKYLIILVLLGSGLVFAAPTQQEEKVIKDAAESIGINLSFSREINQGNIAKKCQWDFKMLKLDIKKTPQVEEMARDYCVKEWKSLQ